MVHTISLVNVLWNWALGYYRWQYIIIIRHYKLLCSVIETAAVSEILAKRVSEKKPAPEVGFRNLLDRNIRMHFAYKSQRFDVRHSHRVCIYNRIASGLFQLKYLRQEYETTNRSPGEMSTMPIQQTPIR